MPRLPALLLIYIACRFHCRRPKLRGSDPVQSHNNVYHICSAERLTGKDFPSPDEASNRKSQLPVIELANAESVPQSQSFNPINVLTL